MENNNIYMTFPCGVVWVGAKDGRFAVKQLNYKLEPGRDVDFPSKVIWKA